MSDLGQASLGRPGSQQHAAAHLVPSEDGCGQPLHRCVQALPRDAPLLLRQGLGQRRCNVLPAGSQGLPHVQVRLPEPGYQRGQQLARPLRALAEVGQHGGRQRRRQQGGCRAPWRGLLVFEILESKLQALLHKHSAHK